MKRAISVVAVASALALTLGACAGNGGSGETTKAPGNEVSVPGASAEANTYMNTLYNKAKDSGKTSIVMYSPSGSTAKGLWDVFTKRFPGITVNPQDQSDGTSLTKLKLEASSGQRVADIMSSGNNGITPVAAEPDICVKADIKTVPAKELTFTSDDKVVIYTYRMFGFVYNTDMVKKADAPTSWHGLLEPKWKDKIELYDPTVIGGTRFIFADMLLPGASKDLGEDYLKELSQQGLNFTSQEPAVAADVAGGRFPIGIGVYKGFYDSAKAKGSPIGFVFPVKEGNLMINSGFCQVKDSPNFDAATLLINWMFTDEGQKAIAEQTGAYGALPTAPGPKGFPPLKEVVQLPQLTGPLSQYAPYFATVDKYLKKG